MPASRRRAGLSGQVQKGSSARLARMLLPLALAALSAGCDSPRDEARREYFKALELSKTGFPEEQQLGHIDRALELRPDAANYLEFRANLLFSLGRLEQARNDYDRALELADRPYLRFERADLLCAVGELDAALADLDRAIAEQPENTQFYPRRALAHLALGNVVAARADVDHAGIFAGNPALAAVLLMEGRFNEALVLLDELIATADSAHSGLPKTLRLLVHAAMDRPDLVTAEFGAQSLAAAEHWPEMGYRYWFVARNCSNAFFVTSASNELARAQRILTASTPAP